jgi:hypothetical protein
VEALAFVVKDVNACIDKVIAHRVANFNEKPGPGIFSTALQAGCIREMSSFIARYGSTASRLLMALYRAVTLHGRI